MLELIRYWSILSIATDKTRVLELPDKLELFSRLLGSWMFPFSWSEVFFVLIK